MMKPNWNGIRNIRTRPQVLEQIFSMNRRHYLQPKGSGDCAPCRSLARRLDPFGFAQGRLSIAGHEHGSLSVDGGSVNGAGGSRAT